jgi:hypothetical protein
MKYKGHPTWQYRYDDTLARYFHRHSTKAATLEQERDHLESARTYSGDAVRESHGDPVVKSYDSIIANAQIEVNEKFKVRSLA